MSIWLRNLSVFLAGLTLLIGSHTSYAQGQPRLLHTGTYTSMPGREVEPYNCVLWEDAE